MNLTSSAQIWLLPIPPTTPPTLVLRHRHLQLAPARHQCIQLPLPLPQNLARHLYTQRPPHRPLPLLKPRYVQLLFQVDKCIDPDLRSMVNVAELAGLDRLYALQAVPALLFRPHTIRSASKELTALICNALCFGSWWWTTGLWYAFAYTHVVIDARAHEIEEVPYCRAVVKADSLSLD